MNSNTHVYIIHGYNANSTSHWFPWLERELVNQGISVVSIEMPNSSHPKLDEWLWKLKEVVGVSTDRTFFVAHSLGCITLLHYVQQLKFCARAGGAVFLSGFAKPVPGLSLLDEFVKPAIDYRVLIERIGFRTMIAAQDDPIVPCTFSQELTHDLQARYIETDGGGHFLGTDGFTEFPLVRDTLIEMLGRSEMDI